MSSSTIRDEKSRQSKVLEFEKTLCSTFPKCSVYESDQTCKRKSATDWEECVCCCLMTSVFQNDSQLSVCNVYCMCVEMCHTTLVAAQLNSLSKRRGWNPLAFQTSVFDILFPNVLIAGQLIVLLHTTSLLDTVASHWLKKLCTVLWLAAILWQQQLGHMTLLFSFIKCFCVTMEATYVSCFS